MKLTEIFTNTPTVRKLTNKEASTYMRDTIPPKLTVYGIELHGEIIGAYTYELKEMRSILMGSQSAEKVHYLADLEVDPKHRSTGLGTLLLNHFKSSLPRRKYALITDSTSKSYPLYQRNRFVDIGESIYGGKSRVLIYEG